MNFQTLLYDTLESTNTEALAQARTGAAEGLCIVAREQTAGRGRYGRSWVSGKDSGLYLSVLLKPTIEPRYFSLITLMTGVAVHDALAEFGIDSDIKWVNDIHVEGKKISGILAEATETPEGSAVVVGIGVNLNSNSFPPFLAATSTSIAAETDRTPTREELVGALTRHLKNFYDVLNGSDGPAKIVDEWRRRSSYFSGKSVRVVLQNETVFGTTDGVEEDGALRVKKDDGSVITVQAGDVEQLRAAD